jgi:nitric oxide reductase large subunit
VSPDLLASPVLWMAAGAMLAGVIVVAVGLVGAVVSRWWRRGADRDTAGTAGWDLQDLSRWP